MNKDYKKFYSIIELWKYVLDKNAYVVKNDNWIVTLNNCSTDEFQEFVYLLN